MIDRTEMLRVLRRTVVPTLRELGFAGALPHFRRISLTKIDLLSIQFDRHGGGFVALVAEAPPGDFATHWGKVIPQERLTAFNIHPPARMRLYRTPDRSTTESWFRYDGTESAAEVAGHFANSLPDVEAWFAGDKAQPRIR